MRQLRRTKKSMEPETKWLLLCIATCCWTATSGLTSASITGALEACSNEGEDVPVLSIPAMECFKCKCINYFVVCEPQTSCPPVDDCYMLEKKHGCCEKCKDCVYKGVRYESGAEWTAADDPCSHLHCVAGVITVSNLQCYTPCPNPVPPRPGQCCPTCDGCYLNGQPVDDGRGDGRELQLAEDPCLKCGCSNNQLHCSKHACPVLQCPVAKQRLTAGECCPRCTEKRTLLPLSGGQCVLSNGFHDNNQSFLHTEPSQSLLLRLSAAAVSTTAYALNAAGDIDELAPTHQLQSQPPYQCAPTAACTCTNGTSVCRKRTCPVLECAPELQRFALPTALAAGTSDAGCCAVCPQTQTLDGGAEVAARSMSCNWRGQVYASNDTWTVGPCKSCRCVAGEVRCVYTNCQKLKCKANESLVKQPEHCCPQCEESAGICTVFGDPHYRTFDGRFYSFMGSCKYQLTGDCANNTFTIRVTNEDRHTKSSAWTKTVTLRLGPTKVNLGQKMRVKVNGTRIQPPYTTTVGTHWLTVVNTTDGIHVSTGLGVQLLWDGNNFLQVSAAAARFKNRGLCGLCGNYNGVWRDDLVSRQGHDHSEAVWRFGNSWRVGGSRVCARQHENLARVPECHRSRAVPAVCRQLLVTDVFARCTGHLNPQYYVESCKDDMCECPTHKCYCDSFAAYARECKRQGVQLASWKQQVGCDATALAQAQAAVTAVAVASTSATLGANGTATESREQSRGTAMAELQRGSAMAAGKARAKRPHHGGGGRKQQQLHHQLQLQKYAWGDEDFMSRHIPKTFLIPRQTGRTPPPIH